MEIDGVKINTIEIRLPIEYSKAELEQKIARTVGSDLFSYDIVLKSLDARNKRDIHWKIRINIFKGDNKFSFKGNILDIKFRKRDKKICVVGSGPAGFFAGYVLQKAGYETIIIERGSEVAKRSKLISKFEQKGKFCESANYAFGEGGAGTFSDGKLTSRTKDIDKEKNFVIESYIEAGAPEEIRYLS
ncbi:MAG: FAD-dependent monooxygenase, partial [Ignavibacteria bacterium]|nr:FAD-dependent monooxygenase [Ignavibacteria bacterium]